MNTTITTEQTLAERLDAAIYLQRRAVNAFEVASLAVEQNRAGAADLARASKEMQAADRRVSELRAAFSAFEQSEATRIADERAAAAQAEAAALKSALDDLRQAGTAWDAALTQLVAASSDITAAIQRTYGCNANPTQVRQIESARSFVSDILQYRLKDFTGNSGSLALSPQREELQYIVSSLPAAPGPQE